MQLDQLPVCYKAVPTRHFQSVSSISHDDRPPCLKILWTACVLVPIVYSFDIAIRARGLFACACATRILATASIRERWLLRSARPEVWWQFESDCKIRFSSENVWQDTKKFSNRKQAHVGMEPNQTGTPSRHTHTIPTSCAILLTDPRVCWYKVHAGFHTTTSGHATPENKTKAVAVNSSRYILFLVGT